MKGAEWGEIEFEEEEKDGVEVKQQGKVKEEGREGKTRKRRIIVAWDRVLVFPRDTTTKMMVATHNQGGTDCVTTILASPHGPEETKSIVTPLVSTLPQGCRWCDSLQKDERPSRDYAKYASRPRFFLKSMFFIIFFKMICRISWDAGSVTMDFTFVRQENENVTMA